MLNNLTANGHAARRPSILFKLNKYQSRETDKYM